MAEEPVMTDQVVRSARDPEQLRAGLESWLASKRPGARITGFEIPSSNGMSSETVLFDARGTRTAPRSTAGSSPGSPRRPSRCRSSRTTTSSKQARVMTDAAAAAPTVPIPEVVFSEPDPGRRSARRSS